MRAARIHGFGPPEVIQVEDAPIPTPGSGEVVVRVDFAGVGNWDALIRSGRSALAYRFPLILGSDLAGTVESAGPGVDGLHPGDDVFGVTNSQFSGACAELALASARSLARRPRSLQPRDAGGVPVVADTAWEMLFDRAGATAGQSVLILGAGGNVGGFAVQLARRAGLQVYGTAGASDLDYVRGLGAERVFDHRSQNFQRELSDLNIVLDLVGGDSRRRALEILRPDGILVSSVAPVRIEELPESSVRTVFFLADVRSDRLTRLAELFDRNELRPRTGTVLPLDQVREAHQMLAGAPHEPGKIVLRVRPSEPT